jgi:NADH-quinone oxidoreductase subunit H
VRPDNDIRALVGYIVETWELSPFWADVAAAVVILAVAAVVFLAVMTFAGVLTWAERRVAGRTQSRVGPNRVGPIGFLQWVVDGVKLVLKEDFVPDAADGPLFRLAPYLVILGVFSAMATVPFSQVLIAADLDVGALFIMAITSLVVVGVLMSGWASNNKWALLGGVRSAAQIVSYEVPAALSVMTIVLLAGSLSMQTIIGQQGGWPWEWYIFHSPFTFVLFFVFLASSIAEGNRVPFDLPEAESELVAGYNTEYSGMRWAGFFLGEFANVYVMSAIATTLFFGGWQVPGVAAEEHGDSLLIQGLGLVIFLGKAWVGCFVVLWARWTLPRLRVDQLMGVCYRYFIPIAFACMLGVALYALVVPAGSLPDVAVHLVTMAMGAAAVVVLFRRVGHHARSVGDRISLAEVLQRGQRFEFDPAVQVRRYGAHRRGGARESR